MLRTMAELIIQVLEHTHTHMHGFRLYRARSRRSRLSRCNGNTRFIRMLLTYAHTCAHAYTHTSNQMQSVMKAGICVCEFVHVFDRALEFCMYASLICCGSCCCSDASDTVSLPGSGSSCLRFGKAKGQGKVESRSHAQFTIYVLGMKF